MNDIVIERHINKIFILKIINLIILILMISINFFI